MCLSQLLGFTFAITSASNQQANTLSINTDSGALQAWAVAPDVLRIDFRPRGANDGPTVMLDPKGLRSAKPIGEVENGVLTTTAMRVVADRTGLRISDTHGHRWLTIPLPTKGLDLSLKHGSRENLYGMRSYAVWGGDDRPRLEQGLLRNDGAPVAAGTQGDGGAPLAYTTHWGVLVDSIDGRFTNTDGTLTFSKGSRKSIEAYVFLGGPKETIAAVTALSGPAPMPPKWSLGFMNSEWGTDEKEIKDIVATYREKKIPLDAFIMDFDFKAWGEDNYGEFRWNSTNAEGNVGGNKFPDGASGKFAADLAKDGIKLVGIMKPRVLVKNTKGESTQAAKELDANHWWLPNRVPYNEYFSHRPANDLNFAIPGARKWYWQHSEPLFKTGVVGWWNDEADDNFPSLGHFQMQQSLYEGQRSISDLRVFSLNRNFYLGGQRYGNAVWSGDIGTGYGIMSEQRGRMLTMLGLAQPHWSMDTGGFAGHPSSDVYARWMQFASVVPIMRVHGTFGEQRQPWVYGPIAEKAAAEAIRWRYSMIPSFYSWEREAHETGVGIVRPMPWVFPDDPQCANRVDEWMLGDGLLVSPIVDNQASHEVYLPEGKWFNFATSEVLDGNRTVLLNTDQKSLSDLPMFVRLGTILARQEPVQYVGETKSDVLTLDVWPDKQRVAHFEVYDDDGSTYAYEHGQYFSQNVTATYGDMDQKIHLTFGKPFGGNRPSFTKYRIRTHFEGKTTDQVIDVPLGGRHFVVEGSK